jgi:hypothetical protein
MSDPADGPNEAVGPPAHDKDDRPRPRYGELRPRPQFGEYATPEEQRASIKDPKARDKIAPVPPIPGMYGEQGPGHFGQIEPDAPAQPPLERWTPPLPPPGYRQDSERAPQPYPPKTSAARHPIDRLITILLLAYGLLNVVTGLPSLFNLDATVNSAMQRVGIGTFSGNSLSAPLGIALAIAYVVGWIAALALSVLSLRRGRISFWIPLGMGVLMGILTSVVLIALVIGDPAFMHYVSSTSG